MRTFSSAKRVVESGKTEITRLYNNPNTRYAVIGIIGAFFILGITFLGLWFAGQGESLDKFVERWGRAVESKQPAKYQALWDTAARRENRHQYERALKRFTKQQVKVDLTGIDSRKDPKHKNRWGVERIPVTLFQDGEIFVTLFRDLTVEKKGLWQRWKLIDDAIRDELRYPEASETPITQESTHSSTLEATAVVAQPATSDISSHIDGTAPIDTKLKLDQVLGVWHSAWQKKDLETYMAAYAEEAEITRVTVKRGKEYPVKLTKAELREKMKKLNKRYNEIRVEIHNVKIDGDHAVADVSFLQKFIGMPASRNLPAYSDYGTKTLTFMVDSADGVWKINAESWKLYKNVPEYPKL